MKLDFSGFLIIIILIPREMAQKDGYDYPVEYRQAGKGFQDFCRRDQPVKKFLYRLKQKCPMTRLCFA
jgi:hypothetical protein